MAATFPLTTSDAALPATVPAPLPAKPRPLHADDARARPYALTVTQRE